MLHQEAHLRLVEPRPEMPPECRARDRTTGRGRSLASVEKHQPPREARVEPGPCRREFRRERLESPDREIAAGQRGGGGPARTAPAKPHLDPFQHRLGEATVGGELAAEDVDERRYPGCALDREHVIPRHLLRPACAVVEERPHPGIGPDHVLGPHGHTEIDTRGGAEIGDLRRRRLRPRRVAVVVVIGRADQGEIVLEGDGEDEPPVACLEEIGARVVVFARDDDVAALHEPDVVHGAAAERLADHPVDPGTGRIDEEPCAHLRARAGLHVFEADPPDPALAPGVRDLRPRPDLRAAACGIAGIQDHKTGVVHPAVGIFVGAGETRLERRARGIAPQIEDAGFRQEPPSADMIVKEEAEPQDPGRPQSALIGQHEAHRPDDVRRAPPEALPLLERLAHEAELTMFEVAQAAVDELGRCRRGAAREVRHLGETGAEAPPGRVTGNAAAVDPAADDEDVEHGRILHRGRSPLLVRRANGGYRPRGRNQLLRTARAMARRFAPRTGPHSAARSLPELRSGPDCRNSRRRSTFRVQAYQEPGLQGERPDD